MAFIKANFNGEIRRIALNNISTFSELQEEMHTLFGISPVFAARIQYKDEDGDEVTMSSNKELEAALAAVGKGLLRLSITTVSKAPRSQSVALNSPEIEAHTQSEFIDKQRSGSVAEATAPFGAPKPQQKQLFGGRGKAAPSASAQHDTFSRHNKINACGPSSSVPKVAISSSGSLGTSVSTPGLSSSSGNRLSVNLTGISSAKQSAGLKLDLKALKGEFEATPVPNLPQNTPVVESDSDEESTEDGESEDASGEEEEEAQPQPKSNLSNSQKSAPPRSFSALFGMKKKNGLKSNRDPGTIRIINHAPAPQLPCRCHSGLGDEFGIAPGTYWTFLLCETSTALELLKQIKEKLGCELVHIALFARNNTTPPKDVRIADDQKIFPLKESWQKKNMDMKFVVKERPFGESVKDTGGNDELKRLQYKLQVTAQAPQPTAYL